MTGNFFKASLVYEAIVFHFCIMWIVQTMGCDIYQLCKDISLYESLGNNFVLTKNIPPHMNMIWLTSYMVYILQ